MSMIRCSESKLTWTSRRIWGQVLPWDVGFFVNLSKIPALLGRQETKGAESCLQSTGPLLLPAPPAPCLFCRVSLHPCNLTLTYTGDVFIIQNTFLSAAVLVLRPTKASKHVPTVLSIAGAGLLWDANTRPPPRCPDTPAHCF